MSCPCRLYIEELSTLGVVVEGKCQTPYRDENGIQFNCGALVTDHPRASGKHILAFLFAL